jgi:lipoprotein-releasing system permease protein
MSRAFGSLDWSLAGRYLRARRRDSYISVIAVISFLGIMLGVATLIVVMAVMTGFRADLLGRILGVNGHGSVQSISGIMPDRDLVLQKIGDAPSVTVTRSLIDGQVMASLGSQVRGQYVRGMSIDDLKKLPALSNNIRQGSLDALANKKTIAIGSRLAENYGLELGGRLSLISPRGTVTPFGTTPRVVRYKIGAIFELGLSDYDLNVVFMEYGALASLLARDIQSGVIEFDVADPDLVDETTLALTQTLGPGFRVSDWRRNNATLAGALEVERNVMFMILTLILLVAALNIISGMVMLVRDKGRDIAILRSMGASSGLVLRVFFITGASVGVFGTIFGVGLGALFCAYIEEVRQFLIWVTGAELFPAEIYFLDKMPATIVWADVLRIVTMALLLSFLSTLYPAWRAARLSPVEALRYE